MDTQKEDIDLAAKIAREVEDIPDAKGKIMYLNKCLSRRISEWNAAAEKWVYDENWKNEGELYLNIEYVLDDDWVIKFIESQIRDIKRVANDLSDLNDPDVMLSASGTPEKSQPRTKIKWLGSLAELGELFVMLERADWIEEIRPARVHGCFYVDGTNPESTSILDYLRPGQSVRSTNRPYPRIFGPKYTPRFGDIKKRLG